MANIFLDTNVFFDIVYRKKTRLADMVIDHRLFISPLSCHIYFYTFKVSVPNSLFTEQIDRFNLIPLDAEILEKALEGPTADLEDNIQLHSAISAECDIFLTHDKTLVKMAFFGKTRITTSLTA